MTETALPLTVTGATTSTMAWLPPRMESFPLVSFEPEPFEPVFTIVVASLVVLSPMTETALPLTVTGATTSTMAWLPPRMESFPLVSFEPESDVAAGATVVSASSLELSPMTEIALPLTVTGASTSTIACEPEPTPSSPLVTATGSASPPVTTSVVASDDDESPMTEIALPDTVTGASTEIPTWEPASNPSSPFVSDACATPAPRSVSPPAKRVA